MGTRNHCPIYDGIPSQKIKREDMKIISSKPPDITLPLSKKKASLLYSSSLEETNNSYSADADKYNEKGYVTINTETSNESCSEQSRKINYVKNDMSPHTNCAVSLNAPSVNKTKIIPYKNVSVSIGNADDFIGDTDEDHEFLSTDEERKKRNILDLCDSENDCSLHNNSLSYPDRHIKVSACDDHSMKIEKGNERCVIASYDVSTSNFFYKNHQKNDDKLQSIKRTKLVLDERTYIDEHGYLKTETVETYKEIGTSLKEEVISKDFNHQNKISSSKQILPMHSEETKKVKKQGNLMSFFKSKSKT